MKRAVLWLCAALLETALRLLLVAFLVVALALRFAVSAGARAATFASASIMVFLLH